MEDFAQSISGWSPLQTFLISVPVLIVIFALAYRVAGWAFRHFGLFKTKLDLSPNRGSEERERDHGSNHGHASGF